MALWAILVVMAALSAMALLRPLLAMRGEPRARSDYEAAIYREQLKALDGDVATGAMALLEAQSARAEIGRCLLAVSKQENRGGTGGGHAARVVAVLVMVAVPSASLGLYAVLGAPDLPSSPAASRAAPSENSQNFNRLVARVQEHLRVNPNDAKGWEVLGPALMRLGRHGDAANAYRRIIDLEGPTARRLSILGQALMFANGGIISAEAGEAFARAAGLETALPDPHYYLGLARLQDGDTDGALAVWEKLLADSPPDAPWRAEVSAQIARARGLPAPSAPGPDTAEISAADEMSAGDRQAMISGMVTRLDDRLMQEGGGPEDWLRLVNAYRVMGDAEKRDNAMARARKALGDDSEALKNFEAGIDAGNQQQGIGISNDP